MHTFFYDLPVYRLDEASYYKGRQAYIDRFARPIGIAKLDAAIEDHLQRAHGGPWRFNEVIGHIRLYFLGSPVRGEYFAVERRRVVRTRTKTLYWQTWKLAPEVEIAPPYTGSEVWAAISSDLAQCRKEVRGRFIDSSLLDQISTYVDWGALFRDSLQAKRD